MLVVNRFRRVFMEFGGTGEVVEILPRAMSSMAHAAPAHSQKNANEWGTLRVTWGTRLKLISSGNLEYKELTKAA